jgi:hypothetical protein
MTDMLLEWLNKEIQLSQNITDIVEDFSNGYFIAEILDKHKQITNFHDYKNKCDQETKINNFRLLEKALRDLEIKVMPKSMKEIAEKRKGSAAKFLYQIKMALSKKGINFERIMMKRNNQLHSAFISAKYPNQNEKYLKDASNKKVTSPNEKVLTLKKVGLEPNKLPSLSKHESLKMNAEIKIIEEKLKEEEGLKEEHEKIVAQIHHTEKEHHINLDHEDKEALESWKKNISEKKEWENKKKKEEMKDADYFRKLLLDEFIKSSKETEIQIDVFDKNLSRLGLDITQIDPKFKKSSHVQMSSEMVMQKIKEKVDKEAAAKKEKERRNRLINVEHAKAQRELENKKKEEMKSGQTSVIPLDIYSSAHQKRLDYENVRIIHGRQKEREEKLKSHSINIVPSVFNPPSSEFCRDTFLLNLRKENLKFRVSELERKKKKKERNSQLVSSVLDQVLDVTESVFNYQQKNKTELIDLKEWKNIMQDFIKNDDSGKSYFPEKTLERGEIREPSPLKRKISLIKNISDEDSSSLGTYGEFEENELLDYLNFKGQWKETTIPSSSLGTTLKILDVVGKEYIEKLQGKPKDNYSYNKKLIEYEPNDEELENLTIPEEISKNFSFGEIIDVVAEIKFQEKLHDSNQGKSFMFSSVPIKLSLVGHAFAGKKTIAESLLSHYSGLKIFDLDELIKKNIEILEKFELPIEQHPKYKPNMKKNQIDQLINEKSQEEEKFKEMKVMISPIRDSIKSGDKPNTEALVDFLFYFLKQDFPEKDQNSISDEIIKRTKRKKEINEELAKIKEEQTKKAKAKQKEEQQFLVELSKLSAESNKGFIILDFPKNFKQAMVLENKLTGYIQEIDKPLTNYQVLRESFGILLERIARPASMKTLKLGGLSLMIHLDVPNKECLRRAAHRKLDPQTGIIYHMEDNPPPQNDHKLNDRLQKLEEPTESKLLAINKDFDNSLPEMKIFYDAFGFQKYDQKFFNSISASRPKDLITNDINEYLHKVVKIFEEKELEVINKEKEKIPDNQSNNMSFFEGKELQSKETTEKNVELMSNPQPTEEKVDEDLSRYTKKLEESKKKLTNNMIEQIFSTWNRLYENYLNENKSIFKFFKKQKEEIVSNFTSLQNKFMEFLKRPSNKLEEAMIYASKYNKFTEEYPELLEDAEVKQEFLQDVVDLSDKIWEIIDTRKNEAIQERNKIMLSGWVEKEMLNFYLNLEKLFLLETDRFIQVMLLMRYYYNCMDSKVSPISLNQTSIKSSDILVDSQDISLENKDNPEDFPRLDRLHKNCFKLIFRFEELIKTLENFYKNSLPSNTSPDSVRKKFVRAFTYKKIAMDSFLEDKKDIFLFEEELKNSFKIEKNKYKYRVTLLRFWGIDKLKIFRNLANSVFLNMDEWIINSVKAENEAMNSLVDIFKGNIERESRIRINLELDRFDVFKMIDANSFFEVLPSPQPLKEIAEFAKFNLKNFKTIFDELKSYEIQKNFIKVNTFIEIYFKKYSRSKGLPETIKSLSFHNYSKLLKYFIYENKDEQSA